MQNSEQTIKNLHSFIRFNSADKFCNNTRNCLANWKCNRRLLRWFRPSEIDIFDKLALRPLKISAFLCCLGCLWNSAIWNFIYCETRASQWICLHAYGATSWRDGIEVIMLDDETLLRENAATGLTVESVNEFLISLRSFLMQILMRYLHLELNWEVKILMVCLQILISLKFLYQRTNPVTGLNNTN